MDVCPLHSGMEARQTELEHKVVALMASQEIHQRTNGGGHVRRGEIEEMKEELASLKKSQKIVTYIIIAFAASNGALVGKVVQMLIQ